MSAQFSLKLTELKSKKQLYLECLKHYNDTVGRRRSTALLSPASAKEGVRGLFRSVLDDLDNPRTPRVCLIARSVSSDVLAEGDLRKFVQSDMAAFVDAFSERLRSAKDTGELPPEFESEVVAQIIGTYLQGLFRTALLCYDRPKLERQIDLFSSPASASEIRWPPPGPLQSMLSESIGLFAPFDIYDLGLRTFAIG